MESSRLEKGNEDIRVSRPVMESIIRVRVFTVRFLNGGIHPVIQRDMESATTTNMTGTTNRFESSE